VEYTKIGVKVEIGVKKGYSIEEDMTTSPHTTLLDILTRPVTGDINVSEKESKHSSVADI